nr:HAMP domain-containing protein [Granulosicoccus sp.]
VNNPYPVEDKDGMVEAEDDNTIYNRFHKFYHPIFRSLLHEFNYYDIFLIDIKSLSVVYSVYKEVDFATSLQDGPFRESSLGVLANRIKANPERDLVSIMDYRSYAPSYGTPASFLAAPIFDRNEAIGILAIQLPADELNRVMTSDSAWERNGLGKTGESYLVGSDKLMRSESRLHSENQDEFFATIARYGLSETTINNIKTFDTTVLMQPVANSSIQNVFEEQTGSHITTNYLGKKVLSTYAPLNIPGLDWAIVSEMTEQEAFRPIAILQRNIIIWGVVLVLGVAFLAILLSRYFVRPIEKLTAGVNALSAGNAQVEIDIQNNDEFGDLATQFNAMTDSMRTQAAIIERKREENEKLLGNILPAQIVERFRKGEQIADQHQQATVMHLELDGFGEISKVLGAAKAAIKLQGIIDQLDDAAERYDVQPVNSAGTAYIAVCGLNSARLDHAKRTVDFSLAALKIILQFNAKNSAHLAARIGVDSGSVTSAVIGARRFKFGLWGDTVDTARATRSIAEPNSLLITQNVHERVREFYEFREYRNLEFGTRRIETHELKPDQVTLNQSSEESAT